MSREQARTEELSAWMLGAGGKFASRRRTGRSHLPTEGAFALGLVLVTEEIRELVEREGSEVFLDAVRTDGDGPGLGIARADHAEVGDFLFRGDLDLGLDALIGVVDARTEPLVA